MAKAKDKQLAKIDDNKALEEFEAFESSGSANEDMGREDIAIPRLTILQSNSPQCAKRESTYVEGADPGMIYDVVNSALYDGEDGVVIIPLHYRRTHIEWIPRDSGGGFVADHGSSKGDELAKTLVPDKEGYLLLPNGNQLVLSMEYVVYQLTEDGFAPSIISMVSSQLKHARRFNTRITTQAIINPKTKARKPAPIFYRAWRFKTMPESNEKGSWFSWDVSPEGKLSELEYGWMEDWVSFAKECEQFRNLVKSDSIRFTPPPAPAEGSDEGDSM